jgi:transposase
MSLQPQAIYLVPEDTARVAHACFPHGNVYMQMYDQLGTIFHDQDFATLFPIQGQPAESPVRLALATILQFAEGLSDRQAADAVRSRIDWKYLLCLNLTDPGFNHTVLSEFRSRLLMGGAEQLLLDLLLSQFRALDLLKARGRQRTDSTHILAAVRSLNRLELVGETMRHALESLAVAAPAWLRSHSHPEWVERYHTRILDDRLPTSQAQRQARAETIGSDGRVLLTAIYATDAPSWLREIPAVQTLRHVWLQNYTWKEGALAWRANDDVPPPPYFISSPHDLDAHYAKKRSTSWIGYKLHITETCDDDAPPLITHVETMSGPTDDGAALVPTHAALQAKDLLPSLQVVDTGYMDAKRLVISEQQYGVALLGPPRRDERWQARSGHGFAAEHFKIDWERRIATCPAGKTSMDWRPTIDRRHNHVIKIRFARTDCGPCPSRARCTTSVTHRRTVTVRPQAQYEALQAARQREGTREYSQHYNHRAGIEGTLSYGVRAMGLRRSRYIGGARTHVQHILTAAAINFMRVGRWLAGEARAQTRRSAFACLHQTRT